MSASHVAKPGRPARWLPELSTVVVTDEHATEDGRKLPVGASGTIVAAYPETRTYTVEVFEPWHCVTTIPSDSVRSDP